MICGLHDEWRGVGLVVLSGPTWPHGKNPAMRALGVFGVLVSMPSYLKFAAEHRVFVVGP